MKEWKVKITYRNWTDICNYTEIYYSSKNTCQEAINDCINKFNSEHIGSQRDITNIIATEVFI